LISWIHRSTDGILSIGVASAGSMNPGKGSLTPIAAGFLRWKAMVSPRVVAAGDRGQRSARRKVVGYPAAFDIAPGSNFAGDIPGDVFRPMLKGVERDDAGRGR
jgi:hypothetical protein